MNLIIHRGAQQIGGSCIELSSDKSRIIFDLGQELPDLEKVKLKKKIVFPEVKGLYRGDDKTIDAILVSHGHGDHIGLIKNINPHIPLYIGEKALKIFEVTNRFIGGQTIENPLNYLKSGEEIRIRDFVIIPYLVDHSGFDAYAFVIKTANNCLVYTGDFRDHGRKRKATEYFRQQIPEDVKILLVEGTMMNRLDEIIDSEKQIEHKAYNFMKARESSIFVLQSSTNIDRLVGMYRAARRSGRIFVMDIFTAHIVSQLNGRIPRPGKFKDIRVFYPYYLTNMMFKQDKDADMMLQFNQYKITRKELSKRHDYCMLIRDTMLSDLQHIDNLKNSGFIYSMWSGYKKKEKIKKLLKYIQSNSMECIDLHTSGHAGIESLQRLVKSSQAEKIIPIHTENSALFAEKFDQVYIARDGEEIFI